MAVLSATSLSQASDALVAADRDGLSARVIGGGTALMLLKRAGFFAPDLLVSLSALRPELGRIVAGQDGGHQIGALVTLSELAASQVAVEHPAVAQALERLANPRVRNAATLGGHLAHADPHMDLPAVLVALGATVRICGARSSERTIPVADLLIGYYETCLAPGEIITSVDVPGAVAGQRSVYLKFTFLAQDDWPAVGVAAVHSPGQAEPIVVVSAVGDRPLRLEGVAQHLAAAGSGTTSLDEAGELAAAAVQPTADLHGSSAYKKHIVGVYVRRALADVLSDPEGARDVV
jgi:carbon-monoxide dehydrogenase medium subunit